MLQKIFTVIGYILGLVVFIQFVLIMWQLAYVTTNGCEKYSKSSFVDKPFRCYKYYYAVDSDK